MYLVLLTRKVDPYAFHIKDGSNKLKDFLNASPCFENTLKHYYKGLNVVSDKVLYHYVRSYSSIPLQTGR